MPVNGTMKKVVATSGKQAICDIVAAPSSFMANGTQYIALTVGGGARAATSPALVAEIRNPPDRSAALWVFEVPR
jgi:hypothetical protein